MSTAQVSAHKFAILARKQRWNAAIASLAAGSTVVKAARAAGCSARALYAWLPRPDFQEALRLAIEKRRRMLETAQRQIEEELISHMQDILRSARTRPAKIRAAFAVLDVFERLEQFTRTGHVQDSEMTLAGWRAPGEP